jgi:3-hydroxybutyryl-CoA dehydrogenase
MGGGVAQTAAQAGYEVLMAEVNQELLERVIGRVEGAWKMLSGKGRITEDQAGEYRGRFRGTMDVDESSDRALDIDGILELGRKNVMMFAQLDKSPRRSAPRQQYLLAADHRDGGGDRRPTQVAGLHFFNPPRWLCRDRAQQREQR